MDPNEADALNGIGTMFRGDRNAQRELRADLAVAARRTEDPELAGLIRDVLQGRREVMEVFNSPAFNAMAQRSLDNALAGLDQLDERTREELLDPDRRPSTPDAELAAMRDDATPGAAAAIRTDAEGRDPGLKHLQ